MLIPSILDELNIPALLWLLKNLPDFPESALVHSLKFCLDTPVNTFNKLRISVGNGIEEEFIEADGE